MKKTMIQYGCLLTVIGMISYLLATVIAPLYYPEYNWMKQAVSDLSAQNSPSLEVWRMASALYICSLIGITFVFFNLPQTINEKLKKGVFIFTIMSWVTHIGYAMFPLSSSGFSNEMTDLIHVYAITPIVVILSVASMIWILMGSQQSNQRSLFWITLIALITMMCSGIGSGIVPVSIFGLIERISIFTVVIYTSVLGIYGYRNWEINLKK